MNKVVYLLRNAWKDNRKLFFIVLVYNLFEAIISMVDILGIGIIVDALITGKNEQDVFNVIITYILINVGISLIREIFVWLQDI